MFYLFRFFRISHIYIYGLIYTKAKKKCRVTFTKKKHRVTCTDSFKVFNVMLHSFVLFIYFLFLYTCNLSSFIEQVDNV